MANNKITIFFLGLFLIIFVSATTIYAGEPITIFLPEVYDYYSVVGNSSEVNLNITQDGLNVTIIPDKYMKDDSFEIIFFNSEKETIIEYRSSGGGGGGSSTRTVYEDRESIRYVNNPVEVEKIVEVEVPGEVVEKNNYKVLFFILLLIFISTGLATLFWRSSKKENSIELEGGLKNE